MRPATRRCTPWVSLVAVALLAGTAAAPAASAQDLPEEVHPIMLVVDTSGSMSDEDDGGKRRKIDGAKLAILNFLDSVQSGTTIGMRAYPAAGGCDTGQTLATLSPVDVPALSRRVRALQPDGNTPTAEALRAAAKDLKAGGAARGTIVLVSDGESTCDDPCEAAKEIAADGFDLQAITVGFRISPGGREELECIADALDGRYVDAESGDALSDAVVEASRPQITIEAPDSITVTADSPARIDATIRNGGEVEAIDVIAHLRTRSATPRPTTLKPSTSITEVQAPSLLEILSASDPNPAGASAGVRQPVKRLGNLGNAVVAERRVSWSFTPGGVLLADEPSGRRSFPLYITVSATNLRTPLFKKVVVNVVDAVTADQAGPLLKGRDIAILGDSFSAGEGADEYISGTFGGKNTCHRSEKTYLAEPFKIPEGRLLACSGAFMNDVLARNEGKDEDAQQQQLRAIGSDKPVGAVVMTLGGNDALFKDIAESCIKQNTPCDERIILDGASIDSAKLLEAVQGTDGTFSDRLAEIYALLHATLNNTDSVRARGGKLAPILVPAYPLEVPITGRSCLPMFGLVSADEQNWVTEYGVALNGRVETAALIAQRNGIPVFFVDTTETVFLPEHTVCDGDPYARALNSFNGVRADSEIDALLKDLQTQSGEDNPPLRGGKKGASKGAGGKAGAAGIAAALFQQTKEGAQEMIHPNRPGYAAMGRAILRWSLTPSARDAERFLANAEPVQLLPPWTVSNRDLGPLLKAGQPGGVLDGTSLQGGSTHPVTATGFKPGSQTRISIESDPQTLALPVADGGGRISASVAIPRSIPQGDHTLVLAGTGADGRSIQRRLAVQIDQGDGLSARSLLGYATLALLLAGGVGLGVTQLGRRRPRSAR